MITSQEKRLWPSAFRKRQAVRMQSDFFGLIVTLPDGTKWDRARGVQKHDFEKADAVAALWDVRRSLHFHKTLEANIAARKKRSAAAKRRKAGNAA